MALGVDGGTVDWALAAGYEGQFDALAERLRTIRQGGEIRNAGRLVRKLLAEGFSVPVPALPKPPKPAAPAPLDPLAVMEADRKRREEHLARNHVEVGPEKKGGAR